MWWICQMFKNIKESFIFRGEGSPSPLFSICNFNLEAFIFFSPRNQVCSVQQYFHCAVFLCIKSFLNYLPSQFFSFKALTLPTNTSYYVPISQASNFWSFHGMLSLPKPPCNKDTNDFCFYSVHLSLFFAQIHLGNFMTYWHTNS